MFFCRDPTQGKWWLCQGFIGWLCGSSCVITLGILRWWMCNMFHPKERILVTFVGASGFLGRGYWRIEYITLTNPAFNLCPVFERNHVKLLNCSLWIFVVGYKLPFLWYNLLIPKMEIKKETNLLCSIEIRWHNVDVCKGFYF